MKRASYRQGLKWIADAEAKIIDHDEVLTDPCVRLIAHIFGVDPKKVATQIVDLRIQEIIAQKSLLTPEAGVV